MTYPLDASLTFAAAAPKWLDAHQQYIRPNTLKKTIGHALNFWAPAWATCCSKTSALIISAHTKPIGPRRLDLTSSTVRLVSCR